MDETGQRQQSGSTDRAGRWLPPLGVLLLVWGALAVLLPLMNDDDPSSVAYLFVVVGALFLVGGLLLRNTRR